MSTQRGKRGIVVFLVITVGLLLACSIVTTSAPATAPTYDPTKAALEIQATLVSVQLTQGALVLKQADATEPPPVAVTPPTPTETPAPPPAPIEPPPTEDLEA